MSGEGEVIGDLAEAALTARAIEPAHGEADRTGHTEETACLNCGTKLVGSHCHQCGQAAHVHRTIGAFFHDLLHGVFHFEGKIWRTVPMLVFRPGRLTREYIDGRRASYVSPIALFLFVVFLTFAVFNQLSSPINWKAENAAGQKVGLEEARASARKEIVELERRLADARKKGQVAPELDDQLKDAQERLSQIGSFERGEIPDAIAVSDSPDESGVAEQVNQVWRKLRSNPALALYKLQSNAYKYSWLLIPFSVPFLWLLFPFSRRFRLYDHTIFVTYSLSFMMTLLTVASVAKEFWYTAWIVPVAMLYAPLHLYRQLRGTYALSRRGAVLRLPLLLVFASTALLLWGLTLLALLISE